MRSTVKKRDIVDISRRGDQKCKVYKIARFMVKINLDCWTVRKKVFLAELGLSLFVNCHKGKGYDLEKKLCETWKKRSDSVKNWASNQEVVKTICWYKQDSFWCHAMIWNHIYHFDVGKVVGNILDQKEGSILCICRSREKFRTSS